MALHENLNPDDTIAAIATPLGESGIGIVRISGKRALKICDKIFVSQSGGKPSEFKTHTVHHGWVFSPSPSAIGRNPPSQDIVDEVLLTVMLAPKSYTGEDYLEISCHGSIAALRAVIDLLLANGCRLACPGEFTKRAFLNGKIDLSQAEAVLDIISAKTDSALKISEQQLKGVFSRKVNAWRKELLDILTVLEANIDFPEEDIGPASLKGIFDKLVKINAELGDTLASSRKGRILREGVKVVICGKPNAGKSSLFNALLKEERCIVTKISGTTRDTIEEAIVIRGIPVKIVDTAGVIKPAGLVEKESAQRTQRYMELADLVILLFDASRRLNREDEALIKKLKNKAILAVVNKIDLPQRIQKERIRQEFGNFIEISAKKSRNLNLLEDEIANSIYGPARPHSEPLMVSNLRHIQLLRKAQKLIAEAKDSLDNRLSLELVSQGIKDALVYLDELLGKRFSPELLDRVFSKFCIGK